jgi:hypothetical protein
VGCQLLSPNTEETCSFDYLNEIVKAFSDEDVGLGFITTAITLVISVYLLFCAWYGNQKLGVRFVVYSYSPMSARETLYNNICYNVFLVNLWSAAIIQLMIQMFKTSISDVNNSGNQTAWHELFYNNINTLYFHKSVYKWSIFIYMTLVISLLYLIYTSFYPSDLVAVMRMNEKKIQSYNKYRDQLGLEKKDPLLANKY